MIQSQGSVSMSLLRNHSAYTAWYRTPLAELRRGPMTSARSSA
ncbi:hypothetical protein [Williamsia herbipolensis]|nr:hypothetical protein [Williamsia herbipolensis]